MMCLYSDPNQSASSLDFLSKYFHYANLGTIDGITLKTDEPESNQAFKIFARLRTKFN